MSTSFDIFETIAGRTYPEDKVQVYTDQASAYEIFKLEKEIADEKDGDRVNALDAKRKELVSKVKDSQLTFRMRGLPGTVRKAIETKLDAEFGAETFNDERSEALTFELLAAHILDVANTAGAVDSRAWKREDIDNLLHGLPDEDAPRLINKMHELTLKAAYFENVEVSPDFS